MKAIVVGTDGSDTAALALNEACDLAKSTGAKLHVVSAYVPVSGAHVGGEERGRWMVGPDVQVDAVLQDAAGSVHARGVEVESHARKGDPADALLTVAEEQGADLIVVGNRGMTGAKRFLLGSVPDKVSHHASCSVLIVRTS
jgi:nucleotide-binding universal stress UspA family protein